MWMHARRRVGDPAGSAGHRLGAHCRRSGAPSLVRPVRMLSTKTWRVAGVFYLSCTNFAGGRGLDLIKFTQTFGEQSRGISALRAPFSQYVKRGVRMTTQY